MSHRCRVLGAAVVHSPVFMRWLASSPLQIETSEGWQGFLEPPKAPQVLPFREAAKIEPGGLASPSPLVTTAHMVPPQGVTLRLWGECVSSKQESVHI